jgi:hypothetical protein
MTTAIIETVEKKRRVHPNSLANLKPFPKGVSGNPGKPHVGPMITPALRRYAEWPLEKLEGLDIEKLPVHEAIAVTYLLDAISTGSFSTGAKSRDAVTQRLDGEPAKGISVDVNVTTFTLSFNGNNDQRD